MLLVEELYLYRQYLRDTTGWRGGGRKGRKGRGKGEGVQVSKCSMGLLVKELYLHRQYLRHAYT